jgi:hypothetical protein
MAITATDVNPETLAVARIRGYGPALVYLPHRRRLRARSGFWAAQVDWAELCCF